MTSVAETEEKPTTSPPTLQLRTAYGICRHTARSHAKNFYYGFLVLPRRKRDAISAVYAFMRHADDISDDPVLMALADAQKKYEIPLELLEKLVEGTTMDCFAEPLVVVDGPVVLYRTFEQLYNYCYHVASVVGL